MRISEEDWFVELFCSELQMELRAAAAYRHRMLLPVETEQLMLNKKCSMSYAEPTRGQQPIQVACGVVKLTDTIRGLV